MRWGTCTKKALCNVILYFNGVNREIQSTRVWLQSILFARGKAVSGDGEELKWHRCRINWKRFKDWGGIFLEKGIKIFSFYETQIHFHWLINVSERALKRIECLQFNHCYHDNIFRADCPNPAAVVIYNKSISGKVNVEVEIHNFI